MKRRQYRKIMKECAYRNYRVSTQRKAYKVYRKRRRSHVVRKYKQSESGVLATSPTISDALCYYDFYYRWMKQLKNHYRRLNTRKGFINN
jgi:hypothetical protein